MPIDAAGPNAEQILYWNETAGPKWVALHELINSHIHPLGLAAIDRAAVVAGERVLDVGCGCGATSLELARRVAPGGGITGIDISAVMLDRARRAADEAGIPNARFENADAQTHALPPAAFDVLFSRFGVMFFKDPVAAFANLRRALRPGGRLAFVCWQSLPQNPWMFVPVMAAAQHIPLPPPPAPGAPGPFAFADAEYVCGILTGAGFADVAFESIEETLTVGGALDLDRVVEFLLQMGPAAAALRDTDAAVRPTVAAAIREALVPYYEEGRGVRMAAAAWIVTARH